MSKILVVDDDKYMRDALDLYLSPEGYNLYFAEDGDKAIELLKSARPDLVLLDLMLPKMNGYEVMKFIKKVDNIPVIIVSGKDTVEDRVVGLDSGAADYVLKPFDPKELKARIRARLRERTNGSGKTISIGNTVIYPDEERVALNGKTVDLKPREFQLLVYLFRNKNLALSREKILEDVWGYEYAGETRTVDVHITKLREKFKSEKKNWRIKTLWGVGYRLEC